MRATMPDERPNHIRTVIVAILWITAVGIMRHPGVTGIEFWSAVGLLVLTSILLIMDMHLFRRAKADARAGITRAALILSDEAFKLWRGNKQIKRIGWDEIETLRLRRFLRTGYLFIRDASKRTIHVRVSADPNTLALLRETFREALRQRQ